MHERAPQKHNYRPSFSHRVWRYKRQYRTKHWHWENLNYASERAWKIFPFSHSKTAISFNILLVLLILYLRNTFSGLKVHLHIHTINAVGYYLWYGVVYKRQYTDKTLTLRKCMYMRANGASELRKFSHFYILKLLFLSIFCWYFRYFVGTNDMLVGLHVATNFQMYRQNSPPPATLMAGNAKEADVWFGRESAREARARQDLVCLVVFLCWIKRFVLLSLCLKCKYMNIYFSSFQKSRGGDDPPRKIRGGTLPPPPSPRDRRLWYNSIIRFALSFCMAIFAKKNNTHLDDWDADSVAVTW